MRSGEIRSFIFNVQKFFNIFKYLSTGKRFGSVCLGYGLGNHGEMNGGLGLFFFKCIEKFQTIHNGHVDMQAIYYPYVFEIVWPECRNPKCKTGKINRTGNIFYSGVYKLK